MNEDNQAVAKDMAEGKAAPRQQMPEERTPDELEQRSAEELRALIARAQEILEEREKEERDQALQEIQKIARAHGLKVSLQGSKAKRGRPRKKPQAAG